MTKHLRLIMLSLLAMICLGGYSAVGDTYKLVTSVAELNDGDVIVIANSDNQYAMGKQNTNNRSAVKVNIANGIFSYVDEVAELTLKASNNEWQFYSAEGYLCASGGDGKNKKASNKLTTVNDKDDARTKATINISEKDATIKFNKDVAERNWIRFNQGNSSSTPLFNCYASGQQPVQIYKKQESGKTATTLSFKDLVGEGVTLINGKLANGDDFNGYTATEKDKVAGTIVYAASGDGVATVDEKTGAVKVYPNVFGTTTITATFKPTHAEKYAESTASYTVINERTPTTITFGSGVDNNTFEVKDGEIVETRVATVTPVEATGSIVYESSDVAIAKVDAKTGAITLGAKYGTAVITAKFVATGSYADSKASYSIKHVGDFVFYESFDKCDGTGGNDDEYSGNIASKTCTDEKLDESWTRDGRVFAANKCLRVGKDGTATTRLINITGKAVLLFKTAAWEGDNSNINLSINGGTLNYDGTASESIVLTPTEAKWEDFEIEITSTKPFTLSFQSDKRFFLDDVIVIAKEITLDENGDNMVEAAKNVNVTLKRTLYGDGGWNTLCVPFSLTAAQVTAAFGNDVELRKLSSIEGTTLKFVSTDIITAGEPCLIKVAKDGSTYNFEGVATIAVANNKDYTFSMVSGDIQFLGIYSPMDVVTVNPAGPSTGYYAFLGEGNKFFKAQAETKMKGFRAFFLVPNNVPSNALKAVIDGTATGIEDLVIDGVKANGRVYNLNGQYVGNSLNGLQPGLYIQNGKKIVVK